MGRALGNERTMAEGEQMSETELEPQEPLEPPEEPEPTTEPDEQPEAPQEPDEEPAGPPEPEPEPESQAVFEERLKKSERAFQTYTKKIGEVMEEDALNLIECPCCPPMHKGYVDVRDAGKLPDEVVSVVMEFVGLARATELHADPDVATCARCGGEGRTATGSNVPGNEARTCGHCKGFGYYPPPEPAAPSNGHLSDFHYPAGEAPLPDVEPERDAWGEAKLLPDGRQNPNYGRMPQFKVAVPPWGITANLTVQDAVT